MERIDYEYVDSFSDDETINNISSGECVEQITETAQLIILLRRSLKKLSAEEQMIINELFFSNEQATHLSVANKLGISRQALDKRLAHILNKLRKMIGE